MDSIEGTTLMGTGNINSTIVNKAPLVTGKSGLAMSFNGFSQSVDFGVHRDICFGNLELCTDGFTIAFWIDIKSKNTSIVTVIFSSGGHSINNQIGIALLRRGNYITPMYKINNKIWTIWDVVEYESDAGWHHVAVSWHRNKGLRLYKDGCLRGEDVQTNDPRSISDTFQHMMIGRSTSSSSPFHHAKMDIDEFVIWYNWKEPNFIFKLAQMYI